MTTIDIDAIRTLMDAADRAPWTAHPDGLVWAERIGDPVSGSAEVENAVFIAEARNIMPGLLAKVDELTAALAKAVKERNDYADKSDILSADLDERDRVEAELDDLHEQVAAMKRVVEAARAWRAQFTKDPSTKGPRMAALMNAVDALNPSVCRACGKPGCHPETCPTVPVETPEHMELHPTGTLEWLKNRVNELTAELTKANQANELTAYANPDEQYLIWSQHHQSWWGPSRSGYRSNPADAGRYTLAAAQAEMGRGCYCCPVPEVPVPAEKAIGRGDAAIQAAIAKATEAAIAEGRGNTAYDIAEAIR